MEDNAFASRKKGCTGIVAHNIMPISPMTASLTAGAQMRVIILMMLMVMGFGVGVWAAGDTF